MSSQARRRRRGGALFVEHYKRNRLLFGRHFFHLLLLMIFGLCGSIYFVLLQRETKAHAAAIRTPTLERQYGQRHLDPQQVAEWETEEEGEEQEYNDQEEEGGGEILFEGDSTGQQQQQQDSLLDTNEGDAVPDPIFVDAETILPAHQVLTLGIPFLLYGTAWKKDDTARLVQDAVHAGFRFIDTACQPKHYNEAGVGEGWTRAANEVQLTRRDVFLQTKFTSVSGQDPQSIPYDPTAPLPDQVRQSIQVSLQNLQTDYLDAYILHSPETTFEKTMEVYRTMEEAYDNGTIHRLGISNCYSLETFQEIYNNARIKPEILQNRFYGDSNWDQELRAFCKTNDIWYQSFWTLGANREALRHPDMVEWAQAQQLPSPEVLLYAYLLSLGYATPLDGTTSWEHMEQDIAVQQRIQMEYLDQEEPSGGATEKIFSSEESMRSFEQLLGF